VLIDRNNKWIDWQDEIGLKGLPDRGDTIEDRGEAHDASIVKRGGYKPRISQ